LQAYGLSYLDGIGDVVLIYPRTDAFDDPLPVFAFPKTSGMRLWVLPFCLKERRLKVPPYPQLKSIFVGSTAMELRPRDFNTAPA
jgi:5-methylcytosine-specific restriction enzyme subunit McrC